MKKILLSLIIITKMFDRERQHLFMELRLKGRSLQLDPYNDLGQTMVNHKHTLTFTLAARCMLTKNALIV